MGTDTAKNSSPHRRIEASGSPLTAAVAPQTITFMPNVTASSDMHAPKYLPSMYELRRTRTVQNRTVRCWSSADTASKSRSATSSGASHSVPMSIIQSEYGQSARRAGRVRRVHAREELLLRVVRVDAGRQFLALQPLEPGEEHGDRGPARDAQRREHDSLHAAKALAKLTRRDELDLGERAHGSLRGEGEGGQMDEGPATRFRATVAPFRAWRGSRFRVGRAARASLSGEKRDNGAICSPNPGAPSSGLCAVVESAAHEGSTRAEPADRAGSGPRSPPDPHQGAGQGEEFPLIEEA